MVVLGEEAGAVVGHFGAVTFSVAGDIGEELVAGLYDFLDVCDSVYVPLTLRVIIWQHALG